MDYVIGHRSYVNIKFLIKNCSYCNFLLTADLHIYFLFYYAALWEVLAVYTL